MSAIVLLVELKIAPGQRDAYIARSRQHRANVLANEPGCQRFDLLLPEEGGDTMFLAEYYDDHAALEHHMQTPYMKAYLEETGPMIADRKRTLCVLDPE